jgi:hypothetical protein
MSYPIPLFVVCDEFINSLAIGYMVLIYVVYPKNLDTNYDVGTSE